MSTSHTRVSSLRIVAGMTAFLTAVGILASNVSMAAAPTVPATTPLGITFQALGGTKASFNQPRAAIKGWVYGDKNGRSLYTYAKDAVGKSNCLNECAAAWPPVRPVAGAVATGHWTIISRSDGGKQWALNGKPVYTSTKDTTKGENLGAAAEDNAWQSAYYEAEQVVLPLGFAVQDVGSVWGQILVESAGRTLYTYGGKLKRGKMPPCATDACIMSPWEPVYAAALVRPKGDFSVVIRDDGTRQWAYKGNPLFTYASDKRSEDANGQGVDQYQAVVLIKHVLPADFNVNAAKDNGLVFAEAKTGKTLYGRNAYVYQNSGHSVRAGINLVPSIARQIGTKTCDAECLTKWKPVVPAANAQPVGFWQITTREDGTRQWTYRDYPLYTFVEDERPGDIRGHDRWDVKVNTTTNVDPNPIVLTANATGLFWTFIFPESVPARAPSMGSPVSVASAPAPVQVAPGGR